MAPRPYRLGRRQAAAQETRARILAAARDLIVSGNSISGFTIDAVAQRARVARMTIYHQFGSKRGLLEALFDQVFAERLARELPAAFRNPDPAVALAEFVAVFGRFWTSGRVMHRRISALAALDRELDEVVEARGERRRWGVGVIVGRLAETLGRPAPADAEAAVDTLFALTSFAVFDTLAGPSRTPEDATPIVQRLARAVVGLP